MRRTLWNCGLVIALSALEHVALGQVYSLRLLSDNVPDYTDMRSLAQSSTGAWASPEEKAIAVFRWGRRSRRQTSCAAEDGRHILDPILHYNSYGAMNCGIISSLNVSSWLELGFKARYIQLGDHTVSEVSWDDGKTWRLFDSSMSFYCFNHAGQIASCEEIKQSHGCELSGGKVEPGHYYFYHGAPQLISHPGPDAWRFASDQPVGYARTLKNGADSYTDGFSVDKGCQYSRTGHRYTLNLRPHESYTRYWRAQDDARNDGKPTTNDPDYFRPMAKGDDPDDQHGLNNIRGNGVWTFEPDLAAAAREASWYDAGNVAAPGTRPKLHPAEPEKPAFALWQISAANVITSMRIEATGVRRFDADTLRMLISRDAGITWKEVWKGHKTGQQQIQLNLRDEVAGGTLCWIKVEMMSSHGSTDAGMDSLKITTITQVNRRTLPALTLGSNQVQLSADEQLETVELWPSLHNGKYKQTISEESDLFSAAQPDGQYKATLGSAVNNKPCRATWKLSVPTEIVDLTYHTISTVRSPRQYVSLQNSWNGANFVEYLRHDKDDFPWDRKVHHSFAGKDVPAGARQAFFRAEFFTTNYAGNYNMPGLQDLLIRIRHKPRQGTTRPIEVTYNWTEHRETGDVVRSHTEIVERLPHRYTINTAGRREPTMNFVRMSFADADNRKGYSDGVDVGAAHERPRMAYRWGSAISVGKSYTSSRASSAASGNDDKDGRELTNGTIVAPTDSMTTKSIQPAVAFWETGDPITFVVDLGARQGMGGFRVATHQPNDRYCHPKSIEVAVSDDGGSWQRAGAISHDDVFHPPGDYEAWEHDDNPRYASLPAGGRLAYVFPLALARPTTARYVRFVITPLDGRGVGLSEVQALDRVEVRPWPAEIVLPSSTPALQLK